MGSSSERRKVIVELLDTFGWVLDPKIEVSRLLIAVLRVSKERNK